MRSAPIARELRRVVVVSKHPCARQLLATLLDTARCDLVYLESTAHAYSHIRRIAPDLVIVCLEIDDLSGFHVLSMLQLDSRTREIPMVIWGLEREADDPTDDSYERDERMFVQGPVTQMN
jgi:DNA-binding response OmpR family regulator